MNGYLPFLKKEFFELYRKGRLLLFGILFTFFGILAPATAKITPYIYKMLSDEFAQQGIIVGDVTITALNSWEQFFGNLPVLLIVFVIVCAGSVTNEFSKGTAVPLLTKGLSRTAMLLSKLTAAFLTWSVGYWAEVGICYGYTQYYWDNSTVNDLFPSLLLWWLFSVFVICTLFFFSAFAATSTQVMLGTGAAVLIPYLVSIAEPAKKFLPTTLASGINFCNGSQSISDNIPAVIITAAAAVILASCAAFLIRKRKV